VAEVGLSTNGVSLHGKKAEELLASGLTARVLDRRRRARGLLAMRGRDHFERVLENVRAPAAQARARQTAQPSIQFMRTPAVEASLTRLSTLGARFSAATTSS
jgi:hypothetical protein